MAEKKKRLSKHQRLIRSVTHPQTGESIDVIFDTQGLKFMAFLEQNTFTSENAQDVIAWAEQLLQQRAQLTWIPVIHIFVEEEKPVDYAMRGIHDRQRGQWSGNPRLDTDATREYHHQKFDIAASSCIVQYRRIYIAKVENGWRSLAWHLYTPDLPMSDALEMSTADRALPQTFTGSLPYVDRGTEGNRNLRVDAGRRTRNPCRDRLRRNNLVHADRNLGCT